MSSASDFGRDQGLIHETVVTGRKAGWGSDEWARLAHDEEFMRSIRRVMLGEASITMSAPFVFDDEHIASVALNERHDPAAFWHDTAEEPARYVWQGFTNNVVAKAKPRDPSGIVKIPYVDLQRSVKVCDILEASGVGDLDPTDICAIIAAMIAKQPHGPRSAPGDLLTCGKANLFPCGSVLVNIGWRGVYRRWDVDAWIPDGGVGAGRRVFSGNVVKL